MWGDRELVEAKITKRRLEWLGYVARMPCHRMPKQAWFGWLPKTRPPRGPHKRWRDQVRKDLKLIGVPEVEWYEEAILSRGGWRVIYRDGLQTNLRVDLQQRLQGDGPTQQSDQVWCQLCGKTFRRESDKTRHKCASKRSKPVWEQCGAVQCARDGSSVEEDWLFTGASPPYIHYMFTTLTSGEG